MANLAELKGRIMQDIHNITTLTLRFVVKHAVYGFQLVLNNGWQHMEPVCHMYINN